MSGEVAQLLDERNVNWRLGHGITLRVESPSAERITSDQVDASFKMRLTSCAWVWTVSLSKMTFR